MKSKNMPRSHKLVSRDTPNIQADLCNFISSVENIIVEPDLSSDQELPDTSKKEEAKEIQHHTQ